MLEVYKKQCRSSLKDYNRLSLAKYYCGKRYGPYSFTFPVYNDTYFMLADQLQSQFSWMICRIFHRNSIFQARLDFIYAFTVNIL